MKEQKLFDIKFDAASGKSIDAINYSRQRREEILLVFDGEVPQSIMKHSQEVRDDELAQGSYQATWFEKPEGMSDEDFSRLYDSIYISGAGCKKGALSQFPVNVARKLIRLYCPVGAVVLDPFAGHNSRMELVVKECRHYVGFDISHEFMDYNRALAAELRETYSVRIELHEQDSRSLRPIEDASADFTITSPPYYDIEDYGDEPQQLGKSKTYAQFLDGMASVIKENFRCLRAGSFCIYFINDFRRKGKFHSYHSDLIRIFNETGFEQSDICIVDLGGSFRAIFAEQIVQQKILPKRHEYAIIFKKPGVAQPPKPQRSNIIFEDD